MSNGEKSIISLCFASLNGCSERQKKILIFDEFDATLNPSLIKSLYKILKKYFINEGKLIILSTHSPVTISFAPENSTFYEVFKQSKYEKRLLKVDKNDYAELQLANKEFFDKIKNQKERIDSLIGMINSDSDFLIITEGKTDWKYLLKALEYFHKKMNFFLSVRISFTNMVQKMM